MSTYFEPLSSIEGNITVTKKGVTFAHFLLDGINFSAHDPDQVTNAQDHHETLYKELAKFGLPFALYGLKARTDPQELVTRMVTGVDGLSNSTFPDYRRQMAVFAAQLSEGSRKEFTRRYWLAVQLPHDESAMANLFSAVAEIDDLDDEDLTSFNALESRIFSTIPSSFNPQRINSDHIRWAYDRARYRGIVVPVMPSVADKPARSFNLDGFPTVVIDKNADGHALIDGFAELYASGNARQARKSFLSNFAAARYATALSVSNVEDRRGDAPGGPVSYQTVVAIQSAPSVPDVVVSKLTGIVDRISTVDADFVQHVSFNMAAREKDYFRKNRSKLRSEAESLSKDDLDAEEFQDTATEMEKWRQQIRGESAAIPMRVTTLFCFSHQHLETLERETRDIINYFSRIGYETARIAGGQFDGFRQFVPGIATSPVSDSLKLDTTASLLSASVPLQRSHLGDPVGVPVAINRENALGQIVFMDLLNATDRGNASIAITGAQGSGKSHLMKVIIAYLSDLGKTTHIIDPSPHGEYEVFSRSLTNATVVDVANGQVSLDPLKIFPPKQAAAEFVEIMFPLLGIDATSSAAAILTRMLDADYRSTRNITSTRRLLTHLRTASQQSEELVPAYNALNFLANMDYTRALIDPLDASGRIIDLPPINVDTRTVVFRTSGLTVNRLGEKEKSTTRQDVSKAIYLMIATYTADRFTKINDVCVLAGDEMHMIKGNDRVMDMLVKTPDRMGRKDQNWVLAGSQLADDMDENFSLIRKRFILKQEKKDNAASALEWGDMTPTDDLVNRLINDTSPINPATNRTTLGREGEGWYNDGQGHVARVKIFDHLIMDRSKTSDTTSSRMTRA